MDDELAATEMRRPQHMRLDEQQSSSPVPCLDKCVCKCQGGHSIVAINAKGQVCQPASALYSTLLLVDKKRKRRPRYDHTASSDGHPALTSFALPSSNVASNAQSRTDALTGPEVATGQIDGATVLPPLAGPPLFGSMAAPYEIASAAIAAAQMRMSAIPPLPMGVNLGVNMGAMPPIMPFGHGGFGYSYPSPYTPYGGFETYPFDPRVNPYSGYGMTFPSYYPAWYGMGGGMPGQMGSGMGGQYGGPMPASAPATVPAPAPAAPDAFSSFGGGFLPAYGACGMQQCCTAYSTCATQPRAGSDADEPKAPTAASTSARCPNTKSATHPVALTVAPDADEPSMSSTTSATSDTPCSSESSSTCSSNEAKAAADRPKANSMHPRTISPTRPMAPPPFDLAADARRPTFLLPDGSPEGSPIGSINSGVSVESIATLSSEEEARDDGVSEEGTDDLGSNSCRSDFSSSDDVEDEVEGDDEGEGEGEGEGDDEGEGEGEGEDEDEDEGEGDEGDEGGRLVGEAVETIGTSSLLDEPFSAKASVGHESSTDDDEPEDMLNTFRPLTSGYNRYLQLTRSGSRSSRSTVRSETTQESRESFRRDAKTVPEGFCVAHNESVYSPPRPSALDSHGFDGDDDSVDD